MAVLITGKRLTFDQLVDELLTKRATANQRAAAVRAVQRANPGLAGRLAKGTPVVLPELPHQRAVTGAGDLVEDGRLAGIGEALAVLAERSAGLAVAVADHSTRTTQNLGRVAELVPDARLRRSLTKTRTAAIAQRAQREAAEAELLSSAIAEEVPRWQEQLTAMQALLARRG